MEALRIESLGRVIRWYLSRRWIDAVMCEREAPDEQVPDSRWAIREEAWTVVAVQLE